ncbi:MAG: dihydroneopterin aldolase [Caldiserica bacterium]|nr:dihydroneopterin aldolase [Caldisericota bacterium]MDH7562092.1 dihydroneopterin aldolase [Caldisericota bacterium]
MNGKTGDGKIVILGLELEVKLGAFPEERKEKQPVRVDLEMEFPFPEKDLLEETVDYSKVVESLKEISKGEFFLLETLAKEVASRILDSFSPLKSVKVRVHKPLAPLSLRFHDLYAEVALSR